MEKLFTIYNTEGYSQEKLDWLNDQWQQHVDKFNLEPHTQRYNWDAKCFCDMIAQQMEA